MDKLHMAWPEKGRKSTLSMGHRGGAEPFAGATILKQVQLPSHGRAGTPSAALSAQFLFENKVSRKFPS
jgi:hypothetical protein